MTTTVTSVVREPSREMAPVVTGRFSVYNTNFKSKMNEVAQKISSLASGAFNSIKETFSKLYRSIANTVNSLVNRVSNLFKKEEPKPAVAAAVETVKEEVVVVAPKAPAAWYSADSLKAKALSVKEALATVARSTKETVVANKTTIIATLGALALGGAAYAGYQHFYQHFFRVVPETAEAARLAFSRAAPQVCKAVYPETKETAWNAFHRVAQGFSKMPKEAISTARSPILMFQATKVVNSTRI